MKMVDELKRIQVKNDFTDKQMGAFLGVSREYWNSIKNGHMELREKPANKARKAFPELTPIFLSENFTKVNK